MTIFSNISLFQLLVIQGTMSGGGNKPTSGRIGCRGVEKVDRRVIEKQEEELDNDIEKLEVGEEKNFNGFIYVDFNER